MKPAKDNVRREVRDQLRVNYPGYFCHGQIVGVLGKWRYAKLDTQMVHFVAKYEGSEIEISLPSDKFIPLEESHDGHRNSGSPGIGTQDNREPAKGPHL